MKRFGLILILLLSLCLLYSCGMREPSREEETKPDYYIDFASRFEQIIVDETEKTAVEKETAKKTETEKKSEADTQEEEDYTPTVGLNYRDNRDGTCRVSGSTSINKKRQCFALPSPQIQSFFALKVAQMVSALEHAKLGPTLTLSAVQWHSPEWY